ncbi:hypothetical protein GpartN1_g3703.t1 [Galdieria partita]|uniref:G-patch domain-containing protein n=1 Tax=Galdieria partita TaxID=83374 RepID=A0A9C7PXY6_9RHOD|nr:hypothetical protein GpartN1_g3703.t1 [Galdieria partita]
MHNSSSSEEEFLPKKRKHVRFWEELTEEDNDQKFENSSTRNGNRFIDLPRPVNFVKSSTKEETEEEPTNGNLQQSTTTHVEKSTEQEETQVSDESEADEEEVLWTEPGFVKRQQLSLSKTLPKDFGVVRKVKNEYLFASHNRNRNQSVIESSNSSHESQNQLGSWEKYTKGFGSKMLQKMGFTGRLGAYEQGLSKPLEPQVRPKNLGLAADGFQEKAKVNNNITRKTRNNVSNVVNSETESQFIPEKKRWKKRVVVEKQQVLDINRELSQTVNDIIIDMRGPEKRSLNHISEGISTEEQIHDTKPDKFLPELQYNIRILKDLTKTDWEQSTEQLKLEQRRSISLQSELKVLEGRHSDLKEKRSILESFLELLKEMNSSVSLHDLISMSRQAMERYAECFESIGILDALTACAQRHLNDYFGKEHYWKPTIPDRQWIQDVSDLGNILGGRDESKIYSQLLWNTIILRIKRHLVSANFNAQQPHDLVSFIERCYKVFPEALVETLASDIVYPRLLQEVEGDWELSESLMPHHWIFPWLPLLGRRRVAHLFDYIWRRIGKCIINKWHPSESFAREIVEPWLQIAKKTSLSKLFHQYVIPRLESTLKDELIIDIPDKESLETSSEAFSVFYWIMGWYGILENEALAGILLKGFFPVWLQTLLRWLRLQDVDWEQVTIWYDLWKQKFPVEIQRMNNIRRAFDIALDVMNRSMMGEDTENMDIHRLLSTAQVSKKKESRLSSTSSSIRQVTDMHISSFKDLVGYFAERNGVTLVPCKNNNRLEEPMYLFGDIPIRLDHQQQIVYYQSSNKREWKPIALEDLLQMTIQSG